MSVPSWAPNIIVDELWVRRPPGREVVRIGRIWRGFDPSDPKAWTVRAHPIRGGRLLVCSPEYLFENYRSSGWMMTHE